jgi:hypothetical protein
MSVDFLTKGFTPEAECAAVESRNADEAVYSKKLYAAAGYLWFFIPFVFVVSTLAITVPLAMNYFGGGGIALIPAIFMGWVGWVIADILGSICRIYAVRSTRG